MDLSENGLYAAKKPSKSQGFFFFEIGRLLSDTPIVCKIQQDEHDATPARLFAGETTETPDISG